MFLKALTLYIYGFQCIEINWKKQAPLQALASSTYEKYGETIPLNFVIIFLLCISTRDPISKIIYPIAFCLLALSWIFNLK